jgi:2-C-methyl-D-erythritol 4-phosphate cytidylyltransferase
MLTPNFSSPVSRSTSALCHADAAGLRAAFDRGCVSAVYADDASVTDEVSAVERLGRKVILVPNQDLNFKITYPRDLGLAEFVLKRRG